MASMALGLIPLMSCVACPMMPRCSKLIPSNMPEMRSRGL
jgi:hypothetical protein